MYEQFYGLSAPPFQINPDPSFYFESKGHGSAHQYLRFGAFQGEGFLVVTGEIGAGKTTLLRALLAELDPAQVVAAQIVSTQLEADELLSAVALAFGIPCEGMSKAKLLVTLEAYLASLATVNRRALLIIDEAQNLGPAAIEELRMLSNFQFGNRALLQSFLVGQPELRDILRLPQMEQLRQRVIASCHLGPMDGIETRGYVEHRLRHVGWTGHPQFDDAAFDAIFHWTGGVPRRINMLCSRMLLSAFLDQAQGIDAKRVDRVGAEISAELNSGVPAAQSDTPTRPKRETMTDPAPATPKPRRKLAAKPESQASGAEARFRFALKAPPFEYIEPGAYLDLDLPGDAYAAQAPDDNRPLLCVAASLESQLVFSSLMRAFTEREDLPQTLLVQILGPDSLADMQCAARNAIDLGLPQSGFVLDLQARTLPGRMAEVVATLAGLINQHAPSAVVICDDTGASTACAVASSLCGVPVIRIGAGRRHGGRTDPREVNRMLGDVAARLLCASDRQAHNSLQAEGMPATHLHMPGNPLIDTLHQSVARCADPAHTLKVHGGASGFLAHSKGYALVWLEHAAHTMAPQALGELDTALRRIAHTVPLVWPMPQTLAAVIPHRATGESHIAALPELAYLELLGLLREASCVFTDSGWMQDQATALGVPCLTVADRTERQAALLDGTCVLVGTSLRRMFAELSEIFDGGGKGARLPEAWDGHAAQRTAWHVSNWLLGQRDGTFRAYLEGA